MPQNVPTANNVPTTGENICEPSNPNPILDSTSLDIENSTFKKLTAPLPENIDQTNVSATTLPQNNDNVNNVHSVIRTRCESDYIGEVEAHQCCSMSMVALLYAGHKI